MRLNATAATVLELCDGERSLDDIAAALSERYAGADVSDDVRELLGGMREQRTGGRCRRLGPTRSSPSSPTSARCTARTARTPSTSAASATATSSRPSTGRASFREARAARRAAARAHRRRADAAPRPRRARRRRPRRRAVLDARHRGHAASRASAPQQLKAAGLDHVQVSIQSPDPEENDRIGGRPVVREEDRRRARGARARLPADDQLRPAPPEPRPDRGDPPAGRGARRPAARARQHAVLRLGGR